MAGVPSRHQVPQHPLGPLGSPFQGCGASAAHESLRPSAYVTNQCNISSKKQRSCLQPLRALRATFGRNVGKGGLDHVGLSPWAPPAPPLAPLGPIGGFWRMRAEDRNGTAKIADFVPWRRAGPFSEGEIIRGIGGFGRTQGSSEAYEPQRARERDQRVSLRAWRAAPTTRSRR